MKCTALLLLLTALLLPATRTLAEEAPAVTTAYSAESRTLTIKLDGQPRYRYVFNKGGAINGVYDLAIMPNQNLVGQSYKGETTDRVIQWTYWNSRYNGKPHNNGSKSTRANVTMEGCFGDEQTCQVLDTPKTNNDRILVFRSRITSWFFAVMDRHGQPDFTTTSRYEVLDDGSLKLTRIIRRKPWQLKDVTVTDNNKKQTQHDSVLLESIRVEGQPVASYLEGWTPLRSTPLPKQKHGKGEFKTFGYKFHKAKDLGGWAMAYGDELAFAVVFGQKELENNKHKTETVYNNLLLDYHKLNILLPAVLTDWPDNATLKQTLVFVLDSPELAEDKAKRWVSEVPPPTITP
ncbi:MAG: hypothetical protein AB8C95_02370 [Phycisphaeraceae bacterium]